MSKVYIDPSKSSIHYLVSDLRNHQPWIYWLDLLTTSLIFWVCMLFIGLLPWSTAVNLLLIFVGSLTLYRAALFVHEIGHFTRGILPNFELVWNVLVGWPLLFPSFFIHSHLDHHRIVSFGTVRDPEYLPFSANTRYMRIRFVIGSAATPFLLMIRALLMVPISWICPPLRRHIRLKYSRMTMNNAYQPALSKRNLSGMHELSEIFVTIAAWTWATGIGLQLLSWTLPLSVFVCMMVATLLNGCRTLYAHAYVSVGLPTDLINQLKDTKTFNLPTCIGELVAPVGQRFHAAHHLFPYLPYHALPQAHKRLISNNWNGRSIYLATCQ